MLPGVGTKMGVATPCRAMDQAQGEGLSKRRKKRLTAAHVLNALLVHQLAVFIAEVMQEPDEAAVDLLLHRFLLDRLPQVPSGCLEVNCQLRLCSPPPLVKTSLNITKACHLRTKVCKNVSMKQRFSVSAGPRVRPLP